MDKLQFLVLILYNRGPSSERLYQFLSDPYNIAPKARGVYTPKICTPFSQNFQGSGPYFCFHYTGTPRPTRKKMITVLWPTFLNKNFKFSRKILFFELREIAVQKKCWQRARGSPCNWAKVHPRRTTSTIFFLKIFKKSTASIKAPLQKESIVNNSS